MLAPLIPCFCLISFTALSALGKQAPERFHDEIVKFLEADQKSPPMPGGIAFIGSSSIRNWDLKESFPGLDVYNRGFGGSHMADSANYVDRIVLPHKPKIIVVYAGDNDIVEGVKPETVLENYKKFVAKIKRELPETKIIYIGIKPSESRTNFKEQHKKTNELIAAEIKKDSKQVFLDVWPKMLDEKGKVRAEWYEADKLHLNKKGYAIWAEMLKPLLK